MPVKQMLDWRCARGKRRKIFIKKNSLSGREEFFREEELRKNLIVRKRRVFFRKKNRSSCIFFKKRIVGYAKIKREEICLSKRRDFSKEIE